MIRSVQKIPRYSVYCLWALLLVGVFIRRTRAQQPPYQFLHLDIQQGLSHNQVNCLLRNQRGFLWIGTMSGLNRYDGYFFKVFRNDVKDSTSLLSNSVLGLSEDPQGRLWVNTSYGLTVYDPQTGRFIRHLQPLLKSYGLPAGVVDRIIADSRGRYWFVHTKGLFCYDPVAHTTQSIPAPTSSSVSALTEDYEGNLWIITRTGYLQKLDGTHLTLLDTSNALLQRQGPGEYSYEVKADASGNLWIYAANSNQGVYYFDVRRHALQHLHAQSTGLTLNSNIIRGLEVTPEGPVWIATDHGGINVVDREAQQVTYVMRDPNHAHSLSHNAISTLYQDRQHTLWVGTFKEGIHYYHPDIFKFPLYQHSATTPHSLPFDDVNAFAEDAAGNLWIGTNGGGLIYYDRTRQRYTTYQHDAQNPHSLASDVIVSLCIDHTQKLWIGTYYGGLDCYDGHTFTHYRHHPNDAHSLSDDNVWEIMEDAEHNLWIGTLAGGVNILNPARTSFHTLGTTEQIFTAYIPTLLEDRHGTIWIGSGYGLTMFDRHTHTYTHWLGSEHPGSLSNNSITALCEDHRGYVWVGTQDGLNVYNRRTQQFKSFRHDMGLPSSTILSILEDNDGHLWISTPTTLIQLRIENDPYQEDFTPTVIQYDALDGLQDKQFNDNTALKTHDGELIFGGVHGFNRFDPHDIRIKQNAPPIVFTDLQIHNHSLQAGETINGAVILTKPITETNDITLRHIDHVFSIEFAALNLLHPEKNRYQYQLEGFDEHWINTDGTTHKVTYTNLDPGTYRFIVKATTRDHLRADEAAILTIHVLPPFWKSLPAFFIYLAVILGALYLTRRVVLARERLTYALARERERPEAAQKPEPDTPTAPQTVTVKASDIQIDSLDEQLVKKAMALVEKHMDDPDFSVESLSQALGMSRVHLYKKLLTVTGKSPIVFIRTLRLQRAAQLLEKSQLTVAEVSYRVGFNNPKYFARYFKEQFRMLPSRYAADAQKKQQTQVRQDT